VPLKLRGTTVGQRQRGWPCGVLLQVLIVPALLAGARADASADCNVTVGGVAFGVYDQSAAMPDDSTGTVTVTCVNTGPANTRVDYAIALSTGTSGSYAQRFMTSGAPRLNYNLYLDAARTVVWGNGSGGTSTITGTLAVGPGQGNGTKSASYPVYGRAPAQQDPAVGAYTDSITLTLTF
jgi:spore coat protein U-like protein